VNAEDLCAVGVIVGVHGLQGTFKLNPLSDFPERFFKLRTVYLLRGETVLGEYVVKRVRWASRFVMIGLAEITKREAAEELIGAELCVALKDRWILPQDVYYTSDLIGCRGQGDDGTDLGILSSVIESAQDILEFGSDEQTLLVPFVAEWVGRIDLQQRTIEILNWRRLKEPDIVEGEPELDDH
jgi:16S rRNA processing protein RimM